MKQRNNDAVLMHAIIFLVAILVFLIVSCTSQQSSPSVQIPTSDSPPTITPPPSYTIDGIDLKEKCPDIMRIAEEVLETKLQITVANSNECELLIKDENQKIGKIETYKKCMAIIHYDGSRYDWNRYKEDKIKNLKVKEFSGPPISEVGNYFYFHIGFATAFDFEDPRLYKSPDTQIEYMCAYKIEAISREVSASAYTDELEIEARTKAVSRLAKHLVPFMLTLGAATSEDIVAETGGESAQTVGAACKDNRDCQEGYLCFGKEFGAQERGQCLSDSILKAQDDCRQEYPRCTQRCENCLGGEFNCYSLVRDTGTIEKCVECTKNSGCKAGYVCKEYKCVVG